MRRRDKGDELDDLPLDAEDRAALARLTPQQRAELVEFGQELRAALAGHHVEGTDADAGDDLPEDPGLPTSYEGALAMGRRRRTG